MERIGIEERRARLVRRHRLGPADRAGSALDATRSLVVLHSTDAATVFLSLHARTDLTQDDIEHELYEERSLVRMLGMRRTLFVVPRELVPVVEAAATRAIAARERKRLEQMIAGSELSKQPAAWLRRAMATALREVEARGEAFTSDLTKSVPVTGKRLRFGSGTKWEATQSAGSRILPQLAMERRVVRGRPRTTWVNGQYRWVPTATWLGAEIEPMEHSLPAQAVLLETLARGLRPRDRDRPALVDRLDRTRHACRARRLPARRGRSRRREGLRARGRPRADRDPGALRRALADARPDDDGLEGARVLPRTARAPALRLAPATPGPTVWWEGRVVGGWSQRRDGEIAFRLLEDIGAEAVAAIEAEAARTQAWIGDARFSPSFLPPFQRELATRTAAAKRRQSPRGRKISFAITSRWICDVPS